MKKLATEIRDGIEEADREEFQRHAKSAGLSFSWGLLHVPIRNAGDEWPDHAKSAALRVGAILPE